MSRSDARSSSPTSTRLRRIVRHGSLGLVSGVGVAALLTGCSASQNAETSLTVAHVQGVNAKAHSISLRDLTVSYRGPSARTYAAGENAPLVVRIVNSGNNPQTLTSVTTTAADGVAYVNPASASPSASPTPSGSSAPASGAPGPGGTATAPASPGAPAQPSGTTSFQVKLPTRGLVALLPPKPGQPAQGPYLQVVGLHHSLQPGETVPLVFHFGQGSPITVNVPLVGPSKVTARSSAPGASPSPENTID